MAPSTLVEVLLAAVALGLILILRKRTLSTTRRLAWNYIGICVFIWLSGDLISDILGPLVDRADLLLSIRTICVLAGFPALLAGIIAYAPLTKQTTGWIGISLNMITTSTAVSAIAVSLSIRPLLESFQLDRSLTFLAMISPVADLIGVVALANLVLISPSRWKSLILATLALGLLFFASTHVTAWISILQPVGSIPDTWNWGAAAGYASIFLARLEDLWSPAGEIDRASRYAPLKKQIHQMLPLATTIILIWITLFFWRQNDPMTIFVALASGLCLILLMMRQGVLAGEADQAQFSALVSSLPEPAFICDLKGRFILVNPSFYHAMGLNPGEEIRNKGLDTICIDHPLGQDLTPLISQGGWSSELELQRHDGSNFPAFLALRPMQLRGTSRVSFAGTVHDLSEQKRQQQVLQKAYEEVALARQQLESFNANLENIVAEKTADLRQAYQQLEKQNRALQSMDEIKSDFVSMVSHELRAPLTNISSGIELVLDHPHALSYSAAESLNLVQTEILRLGDFVETILDISSLDAGRTPFFAAPIALEPVISAVRRQVAHLPGSERITWYLPKGTIFVSADERALISVFGHLIDNALKYAPGSPIEIAIQQNDIGKLEVEIADRGPGIPKDALPFIFDKFYRPHQGDNQVVYGHGLGLYIVRRLLQVMGSEIQAENRPGGGVRFIFTLEIIAERDEPEYSDRG